MFAIGKATMLCGLLVVIVLVGSTAASPVSQARAETQLFRDVLNLVMAEALLETAKEMANMEVKCVPNGHLTRGILRSIINTEASREILSRHPDSETYITPDFGKNLYISDAQRHAEYYLIRSGTWPEEFWMNNSPCPLCARKLMDGYRDENRDRPTVYIAHLFTGPGGTAPTHTGAVECLAAMVKDGFTLLAWDWEEFKDKMEDEGCINDINTALADDRFEEKENQLSAIIVEINNRSRDTSHPPVCP